MLGMLRAFRRVPHLRATLAVANDTGTLVRMHFLYAAAECGLLGALRNECTRDELAQQLALPATGLLQALLDTGVALKEFARQGERYSLRRGSRAAAMLAPGGDPLLAMTQEAVLVYGAVYRELPAQLAGGPRKDYLAGHAPLVARSSRLFEPFLREFTEARVRGRGAMTMLEIGCGSGIYLRYAAEANPQVTGTGIDLDEDVVRGTAASLAEWGLADRFRVLQADIRTPHAELTGPYDLITLYNNIYYFPEAERPALLSGLRERLSPGGTLALITLCRGESFASANFDLVLRATAGMEPLPTREELVNQLVAAGFPHVESAQFMTGAELFGFVATNR